MIILHYIPTIDRSWGGTSVYMELLGRSLGSLIELHIVTHASSDPIEIPNCHLHLISDNIFGRAKRDWLDLLNDLHPDLVHINCCWIPLTALTQKWAQEKGYKVVLTPHGMLEPWIIARNFWTRKFPALLLYQKSVVRKADFLHATAASEERNLLNLKYNNKVVVIPNGIDVREIELKTDWKPTKMILFLSRIHIKKGIELLIDSVAKLKGYMSDYQMIIAGEGDPVYISQLKNKISDLGIGNLVYFVGGVYGDAKWKLFQKADLFVLPTYSENFGIVVAEALASGTPVITSTGSPWLEINEQNCGWCIDLSVDNFSDVLKKGIEKDAEELKEMGLRGRRLVEDKYDIYLISQKMTSFYAEIIRNKKI